MAAGTQPLYIEQGATFRWRFTRQDPDGNLLPFTGLTAARMHIRDSINSALIRAALTTANGGLTVSIPNATIDLYLSATATKAFLWTTGVYDLELVYASEADVDRFLSGPVTVSREVTREAA